MLLSVKFLTLPSCFHEKPGSGYAYTISPQMKVVGSGMNVTKSRFTSAGVVTLERMGSNNFIYLGQDISYLNICK